MVNYEKPIQLLLSTYTTTHIVKAKLTQENGIYHIEYTHNNTNEYIDIQTVEKPNITIDNVIQIKVNLHSNTVIMYTSKGVLEIKGFQGAY